MLMRLTYGHIRELYPDGGKYVKVCMTNQMSAVHGIKQNKKHSKFQDRLLTTAAPQGEYTIN